MEFSDEVKVIPIKKSPELLNELQFRLILCYVGVTHFSSDIQNEIPKGYTFKKKSFMESMQDLKDIATHMREIIESNDINQLNEFGGLQHQGWLAKKSLSDKISNRRRVRMFH